MSRCRRAKKANSLATHPVLLVFFWSHEAFINLSFIILNFVNTPVAVFTDRALLSVMIIKYITTHSKSELRRGAPCF